MGQKVSRPPKLPSNSIDLIVTEPPKELWMNLETRGSQFTLQEYYSWNQKWIKEAFRVLKNTGGIYLLCDWSYSSMYNGLLNDKFIIQNRITWYNRSARNNSKNLTWKNQSGDIWFATKNEDFLFNNNAISLKSERKTLINDREKKSQTNFWFDIPKVINENIRYSGKIFSKILDASTFKLNWILDPFMRVGDVGVSSKKVGRRFIGFEADKDQLLMSMKRIDQNNKVIKLSYIDKIKNMYSAMKADQKVKANILRSLLAALKKVEIETKNPLSEDQFFCC